MRRIVTTLLLVSALIMTGPLADTTWEPKTRASSGVYAATLSAPSAVSVRDLAFSESVGDDARPRDPKVEFDSDTEHVWVSFSFADYADERMSFLARANGEDWKWGDLECCGRNSGRFAFALERRSHRDLGGAAYDVRIYAGDTEVTQGGFGVRGRQGFDNDNE